jgi:hypothetical protein
MRAKIRMVCTSWGERSVRAGESAGEARVEKVKWRGSLGRGQRPPPWVYNSPPARQLSIKQSRAKTGGGLFSRAAGR